MAAKFSDLFRRRRPAPLADHELVGLLEPGIEFEGRVTVASGMVRINTHLKGEVDCAGAVIVAEQGEVEGEIRTGFISVAGKIKGTIRASEKIEIKASGVVLGDIYTASLVIEPGGYFDGQCHMPAPGPMKQSEETEKAEQKV